MYIILMNLSGLRSLSPDVKLDILFSFMISGIGKNEIFSAER